MYNCWHFQVALSSTYNLEIINCMVLGMKRKLMSAHSKNSWMTYRPNQWKLSVLLLLLLMQIFHDGQEKPFIFVQTLYSEGQRGSQRLSQQWVYLLQTGINFRGGSLEIKNIMTRTFFWSFFLAAGNHMVWRACVHYTWCGV